MAYHKLVGDKPFQSEQGGFVSLAVSRNRGAFEDLEIAVENRLITRVSFFNQVMEFKEIFPLGASQNGTFIFSDLISRIEELSDLYSECTDGASHVMSCVVGSSGTQFHVTIRHGGALDERFQQGLRDKYGIPDSVILAAV